MNRYKLHTLHIKSKYGVVSFWIQKQENGKIHFQMDSCEAELSKSDLKELIKLIQDTIKD